MTQRRAQFDAMMKRFRPSEDEVARLANLAARAQEDLVESLMKRLEYNEQRLLRLTLYLCGSAIVIGLLITVWATLTLRPLRRLRDGARRIAAGDYASRIEEKGPAEVAELAREFNVMGRAVEEREREKVRSERLAAVGKMAAMITHEVRNPLSSIALNTELLGDELDRLGEGADIAEARALCRAITSRKWDPLQCISVGDWYRSSGTHSSASLVGNLIGGAIPMTEYSSPLSVTLRLRMLGSPPNRRSHSPWLSTATRGAPARSSSEVKPRPKAGVTPSMGNTLAEMAAPDTRSGEPSPARLNPPVWIAPISENTLLRSRQSRKSPGDTGNA